MKKFIVTVFDLEDMFDGFYIEVHKPNEKLEPNDYLTFHLCHKNCNIKMIMGGAPYYYFEDESEMKNFLPTGFLKKDIEDYKRNFMR